MSQVTLRRFAIIEPVSLFAMIMAYIWNLRYSEHGVWLVFLMLVLLLASHWVHRESPAELGFNLRNSRKVVEEFGPPVILIALTLLCAGTLLHTTRRITFEHALVAWLGYVPWGLFQQYVLNGYFMNRFDAVLSRRTAPVLSALLFSGVHLPNWFLMLVTLMAGYCCARIYRKHRNLYLLGLAHGTIGVLLFLVVPDSVTHHLVVGPGWFRT